MSEKNMTNITAEANEGRLSTLAAEINTIKRQTQRIMLGASVEIGRRLVEAKGAVGHGNWGVWLESNVDYSERTAQNLIRIFQEYGEGQQSLFGPENPQSLADLDLTYTQAVALLGIKNPDERMEFIETHDVQNMTSRELADAIKERDDAYKAMDEEKEKRQKAEKERDAAEKEKKRIEKKEDELLERLEKWQDKSDKLEDELKKAKEELENPPKDEGMLQELEGLRAKVKDLEKQKPSDDSSAKAAFAAHFELAKMAVNGMMNAIGNIDDMKENYRNAAVKMLEAMIESIKE